MRVNILLRIMYNSDLKLDRRGHEFIEEGVSLHPASLNDSALIEFIGGIMVLGLTFIRMSV